MRVPRKHRPVGVWLGEGVTKSRRMDVALNDGVTKLRPVGVALSKGAKRSGFDGVAHHARRFYQSLLHSNE